MEEYSLKVEKKDQGQRIDKFLAAEFKDLSRSFIQKLIKKGYSIELSFYGDAPEGYEHYKKKLIKVFTEDGKNATKHQAWAYEYQGRPYNMTTGHSYKIYKEGLK